MNIHPMARTSDYVVQESADDILIYDLKRNKAVCLNVSAAAIWKLCDGNRSVSDIAVEVGNDMKHQINEDFVLLGLDQLNRDGLLIAGFEEDQRFKAISRREVIRKVGTASMVALPLVSSLVAPIPSDAQSVCNVGIINACIRGTSVCPAGCESNMITYDHFNTLDGSCTGYNGRSTISCAGSPSVISDIRIVNVS